MAAYTGTCYGLGDSRKGGDHTTNALRAPLSIHGKGQKCKRLVVAAEDELVCGVLYVNADTTLTANDTFTITLTADA